MSKDFNDVFNEFLLSMLTPTNGALVSELRVRWKHYLNTPVIDLSPNRYGYSKDYEVVEYQCKYLGSNDVAFTRSSKGTYETGLNGRIHIEPESNLIKNNGEIRTIKRLLDNQIFTVGDEVIHKTDGYKSKIIKFVIPEVMNHLIWFEYTENKDYVKDLNNFVGYDKDLYTHFYADKQPCYFDAERIAKQIDRLKMLEAIADVLSRIYFYGNFKIETLNEKIIAGMLNDLGLFPCKESDIFRRPEYADLFERYRNYEIVKPSNTQGGSTCR